jgi:hypothetical protein
MAKRSPFYHTKYYLKQSVDELHARMNRLNTLGFTHDEFLALFAPKEHWKLLKTAAEVAQVTANGGYHRATYHGEGPAAAALNFDLQANGAPLLPRNTAVLKDAPQELRDRLDTWLARETVIRDRFGAARDMVDWLDFNCASREQARFIWPALLTVAASATDVNTRLMGEKLANFKAPRTLPAIPPEIRQLCKVSSEAVTCASLLDEVDKTPFSAPVVVSLV